MVLDFRFFDFGEIFNFFFFFISSKLYVPEFSRLFFYFLSSLLTYTVTSETQYIIYLSPIPFYQQQIPFLPGPISCPNRDSRWVTGHYKPPRRDVAPPNPSRTRGGGPRWSRKTCYEGLVTRVVCVGNPKFGNEQRLTLEVTVYDLWKD